MQAQHLAADAESAAILTRGRRCWLAAILWLSGPSPAEAAAEAEARLAAALLTEAETAARIAAWLAERQSGSENGR